MNRYLTEEQFKSNLQLGKGIEQWLSYAQKDDYVILRWLMIDKEKNGMYSVAYFESFDEGNNDFLDIYEFSLLDPDEQGGVVNTFKLIDEALIFSSDKDGASNSKYVSTGMLQEEYKDYLDK